MTKPPFIISMTSFPQRIPHIAPAIESILRQKDHDDIFILWLAAEEFPNGLADVPDNIRAFTKDHGGELDIRFTDAIRSFKKIIPALATFPDSIIITVDDDTVYPDDVIPKLKKAHDRRPDVIFSHCVCDIYRKNSVWRRTTGNCGFAVGFPYLRIIISAGGTLYPPHALDPIVLDLEKIKRLTPTNDDFWSWFCAARKGTKICQVPHATFRNHSIQDATTVGALSAINEVDGDRVNLQSIRNLLDFDPVLEEKMLASCHKHRFGIALCRLWRYLSWYPRQVLWCLRKEGLGFLKTELRHWMTNR